jgi:hypothetical protein
MSTAESENLATTIGAGECRASTHFTPSISDARVVVPVVRRENTDPMASLRHLLGRIGHVLSCSRGVGNVYLTNGEEGSPRRAFSCGHSRAVESPIRIPLSRSKARSRYSEARQSSR